MKLQKTLLGKSWAGRMARLLPLAMVALLVPLFGGAEHASAGPSGPSILVTVQPSGGLPAINYTGPGDLADKWFPQSVVVTWKCIPGANPIDYKKTTLGSKPLFTMNQTLNTTGNWTASIGAKICTDSVGATATAGPVGIIHIDRTNPLIQTAAVVECTYDYPTFGIIYCLPDAFNSDSSESGPTLTANSYANVFACVFHYRGYYNLTWQLGCLKATWPAVPGAVHTVRKVAVIFECTDVQGDVNISNPYHRHYWQSVVVKAPVTNGKVQSNGTAWCKNKAGLEALVPGKFQYLNLVKPIVE